MATDNEGTLMSAARKPFDRRKRDALRRRPVAVSGTAGAHSHDGKRIFRSSATLVGDSRGLYRLVAPGKPYVKAVAR